MQKLFLKPLGYKYAARLPTLTGGAPRRPPTPPPTPPQAQGGSHGGLRVGAVCEKETASRARGRPGSVGGAMRLPAAEPQPTQSAFGGTCERASRRDSESPGPWSTRAARATRPAGGAGGLGKT